jgi:hypothetical protein
MDRIGRTGLHPQRTSKEKGLFLPHPLPLFASMLQLPLLEAVQGTSAEPWPRCFVRLEPERKKKKKGVGLVRSTSTTTGQIYKSFLALFLKPRGRRD